MDSELAKVVSDILNRLSSAYDEYREDIPSRAKSNLAILLKVTSAQQLKRLRNTLSITELVTPW